MDIKPFTFLLLLFSVLFAGCSSSLNKSSDKPNILIIYTDDQGSLDANCYGSKDLFTPNIDRLAQGGARFTQFYAGAAVCSPSRAALLTGKTNLRAGLPGNVPVPEYAERLNKYGMPSEQFLLPEMLKEDGYYTALIGKWHLGHEPDRRPNGQGFDYFFGHERGCIDNYSHFFYWQGPNKHDLYRNDEEVFYPGVHFSDLMSDEIIEIVNKKAKDPFFIYWAFNAPHYPYQGDPKWMEHYKDLPSPRREYAAFVSHTDEAIGKVLDELDRKGLTENTLIIFQSDHGHSNEERAFFGGGNSGPYRGSKFSLFEGGIRVPAIMHYPPVVPANSVFDQPLISMDWFATIASLTDNEEMLEKIDGKSLLDLMEDPTGDSPHEILHWQMESYENKKGQWAIRKGDWKLLGNAMQMGTDGKKVFIDSLFLVNLKEDISEKNNLKDSEPEKLAELLEMHEEWLNNIQIEMGVNDTSNP